METVVVTDSNVNILRCDHEQIGLLTDKHVAQQAN